MQRQRHSSGSIRRQRNTWVGMWYVDGKRKSRVVGYVSEMTKTKAKQEVARIAAGERDERSTGYFGKFVEEVYFPFYLRKWKASTRDNNMNRIRKHLIEEFSGLALSDFTRDELQTFMDRKADGLSFSIVDHLKWDLKQIFDLAINEGAAVRNPAALLFTPKSAKKPKRLVMTIQEVQLCFAVLDQRERVIAKLAVIGGMRPGEIFALKWGQVTESYAEIQQRVYRGVVDTPKTENSFRKAALSDGVRAEIEAWRTVAGELTEPSMWVFCSERMTPLSKTNTWYRKMKPRLRKAGLGWVTFQVMRRTHSSLMKVLGADPKLVSDQLGHTLDVNQNVYTQSPVESRVPIVNLLEERLQ